MLVNPPLQNVPQFAWKVTDTFWGFWIQRAYKEVFIIKLVYQVAWVPEFIQVYHHQKSYQDLTGIIDRTAIGVP